MNASAAASRSSVLRPGRTRVRISASVPATIRPARAMMSTSRGDLRVTIVPLLLQRLADPPGDLLDLADRRHSPDAAPGLVPGEHRSGLLPIGAEPGGDRGRIVVGAALDLPAMIQPGQDLLVGDV